MFDPQEHLSPVTFATMDLADGYFTNRSSTPFEDAIAPLWKSIRSITHRQVRDD